MGFSQPGDIFVKDLILSVDLNEFKKYYEGLSQKIINSSPAKPNDVDEIFERVKNLLPSITINRLELCEFIVPEDYYCKDKDSEKSTYLTVALLQSDGSIYYDELELVEIETVLAQCIPAKVIEQFGTNTILVKIFDECYSALQILKRFEGIKRKDPKIQIKQVIKSLKLDGEDPTKHEEFLSNLTFNIKKKNLIFKNNSLDSIYLNLNSFGDKIEINKEFTKLTLKRFSQYHTLFESSDEKDILYQLEKWCNIVLKSKKIRKVSPFNIDGVLIKDLFEDIEFESIKDFYLQQEDIKDLEKKFYLIKNYMSSFYNDIEPHPIYTFPKGLYEKKFTWDDDAELTVPDLQSNATIAYLDIADRSLKMISKLVIPNIVIERLGLNKALAQIFLKCASRLSCEDEYKLVTCAEELRIKNFKLVIDKNPLDSIYLNLNSFGDKIEMNAKKTKIILTRNGTKHTIDKASDKVDVYDSFTTTVADVFYKVSPSED